LDLNIHSNFLDFILTKKPQILGLFFGEKHLTNKSKSATLALLIIIGAQLMEDTIVKIRLIRGKDIPTQLRPQVIFDASNKKHRKIYAEYLVNGTWGYSPVQFVIDDDSISLPSCIERKLLAYYTKREFKGLKPKKVRVTELETVAFNEKTKQEKPVAKKKPKLKVIVNRKRTVRSAKKPVRKVRRSA